jgi:hypothetical protein
VSTLRRIAERFADQVIARLGEFDMLGDSRARASRTDFMGEALGQVVHAEAAVLVDERFPQGRARCAALREAFVQAIVTPLPFENDKEVEEYLRRRNYRDADADYGPDALTALLMRRAGVRPDLFPIKSHVRVLEEFPPDQRRWDPTTAAPVGLSVAFGYGAPRVYHWPMADGRWMVTTFHVEGRAREALTKLAETVTCDAWEVQA